MRKSWKTSDSQLNQANMNSKIVGPPSTIGRASASYVGRSKYNNFSLFATHNKGKIGAARDIGRDTTGTRGSAHNVLGTSANALLLNEVNRAQGVYSLAIVAHVDASNNRLTKDMERHVDATFSQPYIGVEAIAALNEDRQKLIDFLGSTELTNEIGQLNNQSSRSAAAAANSVLVSDISGSFSLPEGNAAYTPELESSIVTTQDIKNSNDMLQDKAFGQRFSIQYTLIDKYDLSLNVPDISNSYRLATETVKAQAAYDLAVANEAVAKAEEEAALDALRKAQSEVYVSKG